MEKTTRWRCNVSPFRNGDFPIAMLVFDGFQEFFGNEPASNSAAKNSKVWDHDCFPIPEFLSHCWVVTWGETDIRSMVSTRGVLYRHHGVTGTQRPCQWLGVTCAILERNSCARCWKSGMEKSSHIIPDYWLEEVFDTEIKRSLDGTCPSTLHPTPTCVWGERHSLRTPLPTPLD